MTTRFNSVNLSKIPARTFFRVENGTIIPGPIPVINPESDGLCRKCRVKYGPQKGHKHIYLWCKGCMKDPQNNRGKARLLDDNAGHCACFAFGTFSTVDIEKLNVPVDGPCNHCAREDEWAPFACNPISCITCINKYHWDMLKQDGHRKLELETAVRANWVRKLREKQRDPNVRATQMPEGLGEGSKKNERQKEDFKIPKPPVMPPNQIARDSREAGRRHESAPSSSSSSRISSQQSSSAKKDKNEMPASLKALMKK